MLRRNCFVEDWRRAPELPDHMLDSRRQAEFGSPSALAEAITGTLGVLADGNLSWRGNDLTVRENRAELWQETILEVSPLSLMSWAITKRKREQGLDDAHVRALISRNIRQSLFPTEHDPLLEDSLARAGLCDLHIHLNGTSPGDVVWQDALAFPKAFRWKMRQEHREAREDVLELFMQVNPDLTWRSFCDLVDIACRLRDWLVCRIFSSHLCPILLARGAPRCPDACPRRSGPESWLHCLDYRYRQRLESQANLWEYALSSLCIAPQHRDHPLRVHFPKLAQHGWGSLQLEACFQARLFLLLQENGDDVIARFAHYYLLIQGLFNKLLVHQPQQYGFEQFQKITNTGIREHTESCYTDRFRQLAQSSGNARLHVEGRFAPKEDINQLKLLLTDIEKGRKTGQACWLGEEESGAESAKEQKPSEQGAARANPLTISLVAHFIKKKDKADHYGCRFYVLRRSLERQARRLLRLTQVLPRWDSRIVGFDAAANELHTPPEVFAPVFRQLRRAGYTNFTFHAGEEFRHLVSGIRAVEEAVTFLDLSAGSRIGHATALGIDPGLWRERTGPTITMLKAKWLDDLVYAHHHLCASSQFFEVAQKAQSEIEQLSDDVYGTRYTPQILWEAWRLRSRDPIRWFIDTDPASCLSLEEISEWPDNKELAALKVENHCPNPYAIFTQYHSSAVHAKYNPKGNQGEEAYKKVDSDFFGDKALEYLQNRVLEFIIEKRIAIETLLTSNVRISFYKKYGEHHVLRWLGLDERFRDAPMPVVCLGTDDPGIFATSLKNECYHLARLIRQRKPGCDAPERVARVLEQTYAYRFLAGRQHP